MAKGQKRSNREAKKPKKDKPKMVPVGSPFADTQAKSNARQSGGKK
jgi:hypothetical protein